MIHINNAGSALPPAVVTDTLVDYLRREEAIGGYEAAEEAEVRLEAVYDSLGALVGAPRQHMAVIEENMVLTLEPGLLWAPGKAMVHEENLVVRADGPELLSRRAGPDLPII